MAGYPYTATCLSLVGFLLQEGHLEHFSEFGKGPPSTFRWGWVQTGQWGGICSLFAMVGTPSVSILAQGLTGGLGHRRALPPRGALGSSRCWPSSKVPALTAAISHSGAAACPLAATTAAGMRGGKNPEGKGTGSGPVGKGTRQAKGGKPTGPE